MKKRFFGLENCRPHHAYLVIADKDNQKESLEYFKQKLEVNAADILLLSEIDSIKIQDVKILQHFVGLTPHSSRFKLAVVDNAELLTPDAANALLKTLEEPPKNSILILFAENVENILKTVVSRCRVIKIPKNAVDELDPEKEKIYESISGMNVKEKFVLANDIVKNQQTAIFLEEWLIYLRKKISEEKKQQNLVKYIFQMKKKLKYNINQKLMLENILLEAM